MTEENLESPPQTAETLTGSMLWWWVGLVPILIVAAVLRIYDLESESIWRDEGISIWLAKFDSLWGILQNRAEHSHAPLYFVVLRYWVWLFGDSEFAVRMYSVVCNLGSIVMIYVLGSRIFRNRWAGLAAAALLAVSPFNIYYSQEARMYTMTVLLALCSAYWFVRLMEKQTRWTLGFYIGFTILMVYTHNSGWFLVLAQNVFLFARYFKTRPRPTPSLKAWGLSQLLIFCSFVFWLIMLTSEKGWDPGTKKARLKYLIEPIVAYAGSAQLAVVYAVAILLAVLVLAPRAKSPEEGAPAPGIGPLGWIKRIRVTREPGVYFLLFWGWLPVLTLWFLTWTTRMKNEPRYTIVASVAFYMLAGLAISRLRWSWLRLAAIVPFVYLAAAPISDHYRKMVKAKWRDAVMELEARAGKGDVVYVLSTRPKRDKEACFDYYARRKDLKVSGMPFKSYRIDGEKHKMPHKKTLRHQRFWLFRLDNRKYRKSEEWFLANGYEEKQRFKTMAIKFHLFEKKSAAAGESAPEINR